MSSSQTLPVFELFADPVGEEVFAERDEACGICRQARGWLYVEPHFGDAVHDGLSICPWCIHDGSAGKLGITFNDSTIYPHLSSTKQMTAEDKALVEERTPGFQTWQGNHWLMCCGRACVYLGEADSSDLLGRWSTAVASLFEHEPDWSEAEKADLVAHVRKGAGPCAYVFQCRICRELKGFWDIH